MGMDHSRRWESGALAHGATDPFGQGPLPWLRGADRYFDDTGLLVPWYVDLGLTRGQLALARRPSVDEQSPALGRPRAADDVGGQIKGFAAPAADVGGSLDLRVSVRPAQEFTVDVYRIGHYGGAGARHVSASPLLSGLVQPAPLVAGRTVSCHHWWMSWRLQLPPHWSPGAYVAVLTTADHRHRSHIPFTVRAAAPPPSADPPPVAADLLLLLPDVTWQAYNLYPEDGRTGASLYHAWNEQGELLGEREAATTVSFDRPYAGAGLPLHIGHAYDFIRWAERYGYDLAYANATDLHAGRVDPSRYRGVVFPGHDEYWSVPMRRAVERARDRGTSLVFLSANSLYWRVELAAGATGEPDRLLTCPKHQGDPGRSALWRDQGEPEQQLLGVQYAGRVPEPAPMVVRNTGNWLWEGTALHDGDLIPGLVAGEADRYFPRVPLPRYGERVLLAHSPYRDTRGVTRHQETSLYRAPSGAYVFASGTFSWSPALDRPGHTDERIQRATANLLDRICKVH
ncbi:N,N-dimethylformamidase beta subunit family domain-containing protein [Streptacidiphilus sp. P02-A3a]|uniref:N,N-dimethylformamidase beta subunit family domain-containing protein n=1 Tax=Streptacidiphilus sp. P02-A3a TaxID=2704468 RepID=UPI0015FAA291|nr:N,N-dimethylformamidase beta subunit family domain-containing protein [Streptacidiphilus sp. P02-A3a]QMU73302.1 phosphoribosylamine--glycine ligase [Streptacidiphilus sp. P02-A3a]